MKTEWPGWKFATLVLCGFCIFLALQVTHQQWKLAGTQRELSETIAGVKKARVRIDQMRAELKWPEYSLGGDFNVLVAKLWQNGFTNMVLSLEKNGQLFEVDFHDVKTNGADATLRYIGKRL